MGLANSKVSIILPVYNGEKYIREAVLSVLRQTHANWELIVVNDGSTDGTKIELDKLKDPRIRYFEQGNHGVSIARNLGIQKMTGDYLCFLDVDDTLPNRSLEVRLDIFQNSNEVKFVDGSVNIFDKDLKNIIRTWVPSFVGDPFNQLIALKGNCFFGPSWMIRVEKNIKYCFDPEITHGEDLFFYIKIAQKEGLYMYTDEKVLNYRSGNNSAMANLGALENGYFKIYDKLKTLERGTLDQQVAFRKKIALIMFKSYLRVGKIYKAFKVLNR